MIFKQWSIKPPDYKLRDELSRELGIHPVTAQLLINRNISECTAARNYLSPQLSSLPDPYSLPDMDRAVDRIVDAIRKDERIAVLGDYDVDGVTSVALLVRFFRELGVKLDVHIPHRLDEGYGISVDAITRLKEMGIDLVITVDNGTRSVAEVEIAKEMGLGVIITDHHEVDGDLPDACAVVNPKRTGSNYPDKNLAGCGVAFMLLMGLRRRLREVDMLSIPEPNLKEHLDLVAIGTVADIVPLNGVNRTLTKFGLEGVPRSSKCGVRALMEVSGLNNESCVVRAGHVAFRIAPRLNAAGRLGDAYSALECLTTIEEDRAMELARFLDRTNAERKVVEERIFSEALKSMDLHGFDPLRAALVVSSPGWHPGVVGIVASKLARQTGKPSAVIACERGIGKGSVRTAGDVNVVEALSKVQHLLDRYGGHAQAAGFTIDARRIDDFRVSFGEACASLASHDIKIGFVVDAEVDADAIDDQLVGEISMLEPYGAGNAEPLLCTRSLRLVDEAVVGVNHLRLRLTNGREYFTAIGFDMADVKGSLDEKPIIVFVPQHNTWNGQTSIQLKLKAILTGS